MDPIRSLLFVPGNRERFLEKARGVVADVIVPDLESGVPDPEKAKARQMIGEALPALAKAGKRVYVRVNAIDSPLIWDDLNTAISEHLTGVVLPFISSADSIRHLDDIITNLEHGKGLPFGQVRIIPFIETALGVLRAFEIATASSRITAIAFGAEDFTADMGVTHRSDGLELLYARHHVAIAARAARKQAIDSPFVGIEDTPGLTADGRLALSLGYSGKFAIHPAQVELINSIFSPTQEEVAHARRVLQAYMKAETEGQATLSLNGQMIDTAIALRAQKLIRTAESLAPKRPHPTPPVR